MSVFSFIRIPPMKPRMSICLGCGQLFTGSDLCQAGFRDVMQIIRAGLEGTQTAQLAVLRGRKCSFGRWSRGSRTIDRPHGVAVLQAVAFSAISDGCETAAEQSAVRSGICPHATTIGPARRSALGALAGSIFTCSLHGRGDGWRLPPARGCGVGQSSESGLTGSPFDPLSGRFAATSPAASQGRGNARPGRLAPFLAPAGGEVACEARRRGGLRSSLT